MTLGENGILFLLVLLLLLYRHESTTFKPSLFLCLSVCLSFRPPFPDSERWQDSRLRAMHSTFLVACTRLYTSLCRSVRRSVRRSIRPSVRPSVGPPVRPSVRHAFGHARY